MRGSRRGYNADIEDGSSLENVSDAAADDDDDDSSGGNSVKRVHFYLHIVPRKRKKILHSTALSNVHLAIDVSLVSLLTSKELDRSHHSSSDDSSTSGNSQAIDYKTIVNETKEAYSAARPLAVIDYGSIELDMSGSLLNSIYKFSEQWWSMGQLAGGTSKDLMIGRRRSSLHYK